MRKIFTIVMSLSFFCGCTNTDTSLELDSTNVTFNSAILTKATDTQFELGDVIYVSSYTDGAPTDTNVSYSFGSDQIFSATTTPISKEATASLSYLALYPVPNDGSTFTVMSDQSSGSNYSLSDLMSSTVEATTSLQPVLIFNHLLSKITLDITTDVELESATILAKGSVLYDADSNSVETTGDFSTITMRPLADDNFDVIVAPQAIGDIVILITDVDGVEYEVSNIYNSADILSGYVYTITLTISNQSLISRDIEYSSDINDWVEDYLEVQIDTSGSVAEANTFDSQAGTYTIPVTTDLDWNAVLASDVTWVTDLTYDEDSISVTLAENSDDTNARAAYIRLGFGANNVAKYISIVQRSYTERPTTPTYTFANETPSSSGSVAMSSVSDGYWYFYSGYGAPTRVTAANDTVYGEGYWDFNQTGREMTTGTSSQPGYGIWEIDISHLENADESGDTSCNFFLTIQFDGSSSNVVHFCVNKGCFLTNYVCNGVTTYNSISIADVDPDFDYEGRNILGLSVSQSSSGYLDYAWYLNGEMFHSITGSQWANDYWYDINVGNSGAAIRNIVFGVNQGTSPVTARTYYMYHTPQGSYDATPTISDAYAADFDAATSN